MKVDDRDVDFARERLATYATESGLYGSLAVIIEELLALRAVADAAHAFFVDGSLRQELANALAKAGR